MEKKLTTIKEKTNQNKKVHKSISKTRNDWKEAKEILFFIFFNPISIIIGFVYSGAPLLTFVEAGALSLEYHRFLVVPLFFIFWLGIINLLIKSSKKWQQSEETN